MPTNKNALTRYALIDRMLANRHKAYSIQDITDELARRLPDYDQEPVTRRCVEKDINYLRYDSPFVVEVDEYWVDAADRNGRPMRKRCLRYSDPTYSIFKPKLTDEEKSILSTVLNTLGSFDGLENFEWLSDLRRSLNLAEPEPVILISKNLLVNSTLIARLFTAIRSEIVVNLHYHTFVDSATRTVAVIPRLLKEYNNRWFLIASACDTDKILTFPLDRIDSFDQNSSIPFKPLREDIRERYEDIIGVTYVEGTPAEEITFWVSDLSKDYVATKPIHESQTTVSGRKGEELRRVHPRLDGGRFFKIVCKRNYELIRELTSYGPELVVVAPASIKDEITRRIASTLSRYEP